MKLSSEDIEALKNLRGIFSDEKKSLLSTYFYSALFAVLTAFFLLLTVKEGMPRDADGWTIVALIPSSLGLSFFLWFYTNVKYEFSEFGITHLRREKRIKEISFESVTGGTFTKDRHGNVTIELKSDRTNFSFLLYKSIQEELQNLKTEPVATGQRR